MTSADNLASAADRYLTEILTSAKLGRDVATIVDLLLQVHRVTSIFQLYNRPIMSAATNAAPSIINLRVKSARSVV